ncbi:hypothetical protein [Krasilnikovia sp. M28-CT-15]|uniref:hypothetical protein n=1 Tax=Krasilnikovia sp. M28-CT-15 TaxID=3373540 RepID=UPI00399C8C03
MTITSHSGGPLDKPLAPVRRFRAEVIADGDVPQAEIYEKFIGKFSDREGLPELGAVAPSDQGAVTINGSGRFVHYEGVQAVEATFSSSCGPMSGRGTVTSWLGPVDGVLSCDRRPKPSEPIHDEAIALTCTP